MATNITLSSNMSAMSDLPPLPSYTLTPVPSLLPFISDFYLSLFLPIVAYWALSFFFHIIDVYDIWPQYRLHTPAEILARNRASRYEVARDVIIQQIIQTVVGGLLSLTEPADMMGKEEYDIARWATRLRIAQRGLPQLLSLVGLNAAVISKNMAPAHPMIAGILAGGRYPSLAMGLDVMTGSPIPAFATWELLVAKALYWFVVPAMQFMLAITIMDTWEYFLHRAMHMNKWLYSKYSPSKSVSPILISQQPQSILGTTASMSHTRMGPYTTTPLRGSFSTPSAPASASSSQV
jgi:sphinganine C4-monooxygenase